MACNANTRSLARQALTHELKLSRSKTTGSPLAHFLSTIVKAQDNSPLLNLPPELRHQIFGYALEIYEEANKVEGDGQKCYSIDVALLTTCRQIYIETCSLPFAVNTMNAPGLVLSERGMPYQILKPTWGEKQLIAPWQWGAVSDFSLSLQLHQFFGTAIVPQSILNCPLLGKSAITEVTMLIDLGTLGFDLWRSGIGDAIVSRWWIKLFAEWKNLKRLKLDFEIRDSELQNLERLIDRARTWSFPLTEGVELHCQSTLDSWQYEDCADWCRARRGNCSNDSAKCQMTQESGKTPAEPHRQQLYMRRALTWKRTLVNDELNN